MYTIEEFDQEKIKVLKYILYKKRSEQEVRNKFAKTIETNLLEDIIEYLKQADYINDKEYLEKTVHNFMQLKNLSQKELQYKLLAKGLQKKQIEDYFYQNTEELEEYEIQSIRNLYDKKTRTMEPQEIKQHLLKKGYQIENIHKVIKE